MRRSLSWSVGDQQPVASVMRRWRKSLVHLEYPRLCFLRLACKRAWFLRWRAAHEVPAKKTVAPLWHPHVRPSQTIITPDRARRACAVILWTDKRTLPQVGRRTSIRRSLIDKELRCSRREEVPAEAEAGRSPQSGRDGTTDTEGSL
ncbi:hypothetical protein TcBrA4_0060330 [Trypanosoma cruzi]|nr:hypothetical protein TcBrA4_0060330 [Trypanosoma cruzi]